MRGSMATAWLALLSLAGPRLDAADAPTIAPGTRLRIAAQDAGRARVGSLATLDDQSLTLRLDDRGGSWSVRRTDITALAVSRGRGPRGKGMLIGAGIGLGAAIIFGLATINSDGIGPTGAAGGAVFAAWTVPIGALAGLASRPAERWQELPLDALRLEPAPARARESPGPSR
jgi:hypothetical protein